MALGQKNCGTFGQKWNVLAYLQTTEVKCSLWRQLEIQRIGDEYILQVLRHTWDSYLLKCIECLILKIWVCYLIGNHAKRSTVNQILIFFQEMKVILC